MNDMNGGKSGFDIDRNSLDVMDEVGDLVTDGVQIEYGYVFFSLPFRIFRLVSGNPRLRVFFFFCWCKGRTLRM